MPACDWPIPSLRIPVAEEDGEAPKLRPCLVLETGTLNGHRSVTLAYGTGAPAKGKYGYEIIVKGKPAMRAAGLTKATRFVAIRRITVSTEHPGFEPLCGTPIIGRLDAPLLQRMDAVRARLWAEHDIAAERRHERDLERRRWQREERRIRIENRARLAAEAAIGTDIIPNLSHLKRAHPQDVRKLLVPDRLFEERTLVDIEVLIEIAERSILDGTTQQTVHDASPENVSTESWRLTERDKRATEVYLALPVLHDLRDRLQAIRDLLATRSVLEAMNADL